MAIIRRKKPASHVTPKKHNLRNPLLKQGSTALLVYRYVKDHPGCHAAEIRALVGSGQALSDLVKEGLVRREGEKRTSYEYFAVPEHETGQGRDRVEVEITLFVNRYGEYSISARMENQNMTAHEDFPVEILRKKVDISVPSPIEPYWKRDILEVQDLQTFAKPQEAEFLKPKGPLTIDHE